jgi:hypothetical protein
MYNIPLGLCILGPTYWWTSELTTGYWFKIRFRTTDWLFTLLTFLLGMSKTFGGSPTEFLVIRYVHHMCIIFFPRARESKLDCALRCSAPPVDLRVNLAAPKQTGHGGWTSLSWSMPCRNSGSTCVLCVQMHCAHMRACFPRYTLHKSERGASRCLDPFSPALLGPKNGGS